MTFTHPLARSAKVWPLGQPDESKTPVLVVITTLQLNRDNDKYKKDKVTRLADAAKEWVSFNQNLATDFMLVNRVKDW